jgi:hypothetical protein
MKANDALEAARAAGIVLAVDGEDLVLEAASTPPAAVLDALSQQKAEIVALLRPGRVGWSSEDWQVFFDERTGIAEFDGGLSRPQADAQAFACCVAEWLNQHPVSSPPGHCIACGGRDHAHDALLPYGIEDTGHAWLHTRCCCGWYENRKAQAVVALASLRIAEPPDPPGAENGGRLRTGPADRAAPDSTADPQNNLSMARK